MKRWLDGALVEDGPLLGLDDRAFLLGDGVYETLLVENARPAFLEAHLARMRTGLRILKINADPDAAAFAAAASALAAANGHAGRASLRITISRGRGARGLAFSGGSPTIAMATAALAPSPSPVRLRLSARSRYTRAAGAAFKSMAAMLDNILAHNEALADGGDEGLMLNEHGRLSCAAAANIFVIDRDGRVATPAVGEGALPGIVRGLLIEGAHEHGVPIAAEPIETRALEGALLFLSNSLKGLVEARLGEVAPSARAGEPFRRLQTWYERRLARELTVTPP